MAEGRVSRPNGRVENQVGNLRDQLFRPKPRVKHDLGGVPGRTGAFDGIAWAVRWLCREGGARHQHVLDHGLAAVEAACAEALEAGIASGDVILTVLARQRQPPVPPSITTPDALRLRIEPMADCGRYDSIRKVA